MVFALAIVAWWMQGVVRALLGGLALYFFLMALSEISSRFERKKLVLSVETGENDGRFADEDEVRSSRQRTIPVFSSGAQTIRGQEAWPISRINGFGL
ncbi:hypothetical protein D9T17_10970 [Lysobacter enzymogenes]|uniref:Uncharacterized protein n=1 Tax=Lysobacter enzymogenes TaxID=69 RepID=A0A3N2RHU8_LYSEN|nr:hypothetical protein D9T17_10970 [Lysobacter enzymogenes]